MASSGGAGLSSVRRASSVVHLSSAQISLSSHLSCHVRPSFAVARPCRSPDLLSLGSGRRSVPRLEQTLRRRRQQLKEFLFYSAHHKIVIVGGGTAGATVSAQLKRAFAAERRPLEHDDLAVIEPAQTHHCKLKR